MSEEPKLSQEQIDRFVGAIDRVMRRRRLLLIGYLVAVLVLVVGFLAAILIYLAAPPGTHYGWVFFIPVTLVGLIFWAFGRFAGRKKPSS